MEEIKLTQDLEIGKRTITREPLEPYVEYDFVAKAGAILKKENGFVEARYENERGQTAHMPILSPIIKVDSLTEKPSIEYSPYMGQIVWNKAIESGNYERLPISK